MRRAHHLHGSDLTWAIAFVVPYAVMFLALTLYPVLYALWMARSPGLYADLFEHRLYWSSVVNTSVDPAGPPPETKNTVGKSPNVHSVESSVAMR